MPRGTNRDENGPVSVVNGLFPLLVSLFTDHHMLMQYYATPPPARPGGGDTTDNRGFTLIELLVVIAIIAVLAAILFPVFARVQERGRQAACGSNLRQLATANQLYANDYEGYFVPAAPGYFVRDDRRWFGVRNPQGRFEPRDGPLVPYLGDGGALRVCPSFRTNVGFDMGTGGYVTTRWEWAHA
jgi:prepilin-type N-terminal cleavage/methylation domain-containing protein